jgi:magnesium-transporting ATPase (P-type)
MVGFWVALLTFTALIVRMLIEVGLSEDGEYFTMDNGVFILDAFIIAVTVVVVAVPEGLPLAVTISLAFSVS